MVKISVLLPVYNNKENIFVAIQSVFDQSFTDWELIIVDDGSTDGTYDAIMDFIKNKNYNVTLLKNDTNVGAYISLNKALLVAIGEYVCRINSDDTIINDYFLTNLKILDKMPGYVATKSKVKKFEGDKVISIAYGEISLFYRRTIIGEIGYYDSVRFGADSEFMGRVDKKYRYKVYFINVIMYHAKKKENSLTNSLDTEDKDIMTTYERRFNLWHAEGFNLYVPFPLTERPFKVDEKML